MALGAGASDARRIVALGVLAAILYTRPDLVGRSTVRALAEMVPSAGSLGRMRSSTGSPKLTEGAARTLGLFAGSPAATAAAEALIGQLVRRRLPGPCRIALLKSLAVHARWHPGAVSLDAAIRVARATSDGAGLDLLLSEIVEPLIYRRRSALGAAIVDRLIRTFGARPRFRYIAAGLAERAGSRRAIRPSLDRWLAARFRLRPAAAAALRRGPFALLAVHNVTGGQGDEIVRVVPLIQGFLDGNSSLTVTIVSQRPYLYDHPRVDAVPIPDARAVERTLGAPYDGIVDWNARTVPEASIRADLAERVGAEGGPEAGSSRGAARSASPARRARVVIRALTGQIGFTFETVRIGDRSVARTLGLDRMDRANPYDASGRLLAELGLPQRSAQQAPRAGSMLVGAPSPEAHATWRRVVGPGDRPAALVNAFGGRHPLKGFTREKAAQLATGIGGLVDEGFTVVLLPNGEPWGGAAMIRAVLQHLDRERRSRVAVAPDPAGTATAASAGVRVLCRTADMPSRATERPTLCRADRVMRLYKYFASYADLVVTVEGWMMHVAYALGRPFRLLMAPYSAHDWVPERRGADQRLVARMSSATPEPPDLLRPGDPPPAPHHPRKPRLVAAVASLADVSDPDASRMLEAVAASPDAELRAAAIQALGRRGATADERARPLEQVRERLSAALGDSAARVRAAAARALLDSALPLDPSARARLDAHVRIARQDWAAVAALGGASLPALDAATRDADEVIRREARWMAATMLRRFARPAARRGPRGHTT